MEKQYCGYITILGNPNSGKSTLINKILKKKISITCHKKNTTRYKILGIKTNHNIQSIYIDTPGIDNTKNNIINYHLNKISTSSIYQDTNLIIYLIDISKKLNSNHHLIKILISINIPIIIAINKIDQLKDKSKILSIINFISKKIKCSEIIPVSAKYGNNINVLENTVNKFLPEREFIYSKTETTTSSAVFFISEIIREKTMRFLGDELPYKTMINTNVFDKNKKKIIATILVESKSQKAIVIGKNGNKIKQISMASRIDIDKYLGYKIFLKLFVIHKNKWIFRKELIKSLEYNIK